MLKRFLTVIFILLILAIPANAVIAQSYSFSLDRETVDAYWNEDGTLTLEYVFVFSNDASAPPIQYVDLGLPNNNYDLSSISAEINQQPVRDISAEDYEGLGSAGVAINLGQRAIPPGSTGRVHVFVGTIRNVLRIDDQDPDYASAVFSPTWFGSEFVHGTTNLTVTFHFPPGVQPDEPRWHASPEGFPPTPDIGTDERGRVTYTWSNESAQPDKQYKFGASFPKRYVPDSAVSAASITERYNIDPDALITGLFCIGFAAFFILTTGFSYWSNRRRRLQYLPPKISIEGHGIKRGLTAIEAAILMEQPMDKVLTMILFAAIKKGAARVASRDPLELDIEDPLPENLRSYEKDFLAAFQIQDKRDRRRKLQSMMVKLVRSVANKMKGFSRKETIDYYEDIMKRAWNQVEAADTPEVKSQRFDEVMEWTMLDREYDDRTRRVFRTGPVFVPTWWSNYDPTYSRPSPPRTAPVSTGERGGASLPHLPGSDFAASMVRGVESFSAGVIGNLSDFTGKITNQTNPVPASSSGRSSGGGCACACAGCACACAGGGR